MISVQILLSPEAGLEGPSGSLLLLSSVILHSSVLLLSSVLQNSPMSSLRNLKKKKIPNKNHRQMDRYLNFSISNSVFQFLELAYLKQPNVNFMAFFFLLKKTLLLSITPNTRSQGSALIRENSKSIVQLVGLFCNCSEPLLCFLLFSCRVDTAV